MACLGAPVVFSTSSAREPTLDELLGDVAMRLLMRCDGVTERDIRALLGILKDRRAMRLRETGRGPGVAVSVAHWPDRRGTVASSRRENPRN